MSSDESRIASVYAVCGTDSFLKQSVVQELCRRMFDAGAVEDGPTRMDGSEVDLATVLDDVRTYSLLGGRRLVVVDNADTLITKHRKQLESYCESPSDSGTLILICTKLAANTRLYKIIERNGNVIKREPLKRHEVSPWIIRRGKTQYKKQLDQRAAGLLRESVGDDLGLLDSELGKLSLYVGERPEITTSDIEALVGRVREENIFGVTDAMAEGDLATAFAQWERVLATDRAAPARAVGGLAWGLRKLLGLKVQAESGVSLATLSAQAYTRSDLLQRRLLAVTVESLEQQLCDLLEIDVGSKVGLCEVSSAVERFIIRHSNGSRSQRKQAAG